VNRQQGRLSEAEKNFRGVLEDRTQAMIDRAFDFSLDYEVINLHGQALFDLAKQARGEQRKAEREAYLRRAAEQFEKTLQIDWENVTAHYNLQLLYAQLGEEEQAAEHRRAHARYKPDDNAADRAIALARKRYPAANHAAEAIVIYSLNRDGAPGLPASASEPHAGGGR
jgi:tetratricopeptide (TPR) repeat protein